MTVLREKKEIPFQSIPYSGLAEWHPYLKSIGDFLAVVHSPVPYRDWQELSNINSDAASTVIKC